MADGKQQGDWPTDSLSGVKRQKVHDRQFCVNEDECGCQCVRERSLTLSGITVRWRRPAVPAVTLFWLLGGTLALRTCAGLADPLDS